MNTKTSEKFSSYLDNLNEDIFSAQEYNSHRVRAPISRILGLVNLCAHLNELSEKEKYVIDEINNATLEMDRAIRKVSQLLVS